MSSSRVIKTYYPSSLFVGSVFASLLKFVTSKSVLTVLSQSFRHRQPPWACSQIRSNKAVFCLVSVLTLLNPFHGVCSATFELLLVTSLLKMALKHRAEMLSSAAKCRTAVMCLTVRIHGLEELLLGTSASAVGSVQLFGVHKSTSYIQKKEKGTHQSLPKAVPSSTEVTSAVLWKGSSTCGFLRQRLI